MESFKEAYPNFKIWKRCSKLPLAKKVSNCLIILMTIFHSINKTTIHTHEKFLGCFIKQKMIRKIRMICRVVENWLHLLLLYNFQFSFFFFPKFVQNQSQNNYQSYTFVTFEDFECYKIFLIRTHYHIC